MPHLVFVPLPLTGKGLPLYQNPPDSQFKTLLFYPSVFFLTLPKPLTGGVCRPIRRALLYLLNCWHSYCFVHRKANTAATFLAMGEVASGY
jgi:hypothetical protein